ncbi:MAG: hypothetical protein C4527_08415 [Candidatus Omnitrophota bacterium]|nr:MAG: hypothetical protein C4527_08415 [Candidatus Omnitrophota bacterium]
MKQIVTLSLILSLFVPFAPVRVEGKDNTPPQGFIALFNGKDLSGWKGLVADPLKRANMTKDELAAAQKKLNYENRRSGGSTIRKESPLRNLMRVDATSVLSKRIIRQT